LDAILFAPLVELLFVFVSSFWRVAVFGKIKPPGRNRNKITVIILVVLKRVFQIKIISDKKVIVQKEKICQSKRLLNSFQKR
jgi:hypothetical protein